MDSIIDLVLHEACKEFSIHYAQKFINQLISIHKEDINKF